MQQRRRGVPGAGAVGFGAALLGLSLILAWFPDRTGWEAFSGVDALVFLLALVCLGLLVFASSRHTLCRFFTRGSWACARWSRSSTELFASRRESQAGGWVSEC